MGGEWDDLVHDLTLDMAGLEYRQFVIVEFNTPLAPNPYAQATPTAAGDWLCEVVSEHYLGTELWPLDEYALASLGWAAPPRSDDNWEQTADDARAARCCWSKRCGSAGGVQIRSVHLAIGHFPTPGDGGGRRHSCPGDRSVWPPDPLPASTIRAPCRCRIPAYADLASPRSRCGARPAPLRLNVPRADQQGVRTDRRLNRPIRPVHGRVLDVRNLDAVLGERGVPGGRIASPGIGRRRG